MMQKKQFSCSTCGDLLSSMHIYKYFYLVLAAQMQQQQSTTPPMHLGKCRACGCIVSSIDSAPAKVTILVGYSNLLLGCLVKGQQKNDMWWYFCNTWVNLCVFFPWNRGGCCQCIFFGCWLGTTLRWLNMLQFHKISSKSILVAAFLKEWCPWHTQESHGWTRKTQTSEKW